MLSVRSNEYSLKKTTQFWRGHPGNKFDRDFLAQGNILKNISQHPQIPQLLAFFECDRLFYLVREHVSGISLERQLQDSRINETAAISWLREIAELLEFIHRVKYSSSQYPAFKSNSASRTAERC